MRDATNVTSKAIKANFTLESPALEWAVECNERFLIVDGLPYPALIGRTLLNPLGMSNEVLQRRPERPDDNTLERPDQIQSLEDLSEYVREGVILPQVCPELTETQQTEIRDLLHEYQEIFDQLPKEGADMDPFTIDLLNDRKVTKVGPRPLARKLQTAV